MAEHSDWAAGRSLSARIPAGSSSVQLILRARDGDERARDELCARYLPRLRRWAHGRMPAWAREHLDTEDIVQETLVQTLRHIDGFRVDHDSAFWAYTCRALRNRVTDVVRRAAGRPAVGPIANSDDHLADDPSPLEHAIGREALRRYEDALLRLRPIDRELIIAKVELGLDYLEIAELLDKVSIAAARVAVSRALIRLAAEMGHERSA